MTKVTKTTIQVIPAKFGRCGFGDETCSVHATIDRDAFAKLCEEHTAALHSLVKQKQEAFCETDLLAFLNSTTE